MTINPPWKKPNSLRRVEVLGLTGWRTAIWDEQRKGWYHHSMSKVCCVVAWRDIKTEADDE